MKKIISFILLAALPLFLSGCALVSTALSAAAAYGIYRAFSHH